MPEVEEGGFVIQPQRVPFSMSTMDLPDGTFAVRFHTVNGIVVLIAAREEWAGMAKMLLAETTKPASKLIVPTLHADLTQNGKGPKE